jgi:hypothetical protein
MLTETPMINDLQDFLYDKCPSWGLGPLHRVHFFIYNNYHPHCTNINIFWFGGNKKSPIVFTRLSRDPSPLEHEYGSLHQLRDKGVLCTPRPLHFGFLSGFHSLWMTGMPGYRIKPGDVSVSSYLGDLTTALASMHNKIRNHASRSTISRTENFLIGPLESVRTFGGAKLASLFKKHYENGSRKLLDGVLPIIGQHGDMSVGNVLREGKNFFFVDWESFSVLDWPAFDLFTLLTSILDGFGDDASAWPVAFTRQLPSSIRSYCNRISLPLESAEPLFYLTLINWFHLQYQEGREAGYKRKYRILENSLENKNLWLKTFFGYS